MSKRAAKQALTGPSSLFRGKIRAPISVTLTPRHHQLLEEAQARLGLSRSDVVGLLVECFASSVRVPLDLAMNDGE